MEAAIAALLRELSFPFPMAPMKTMSNLLAVDRVRPRLVVAVEEGLSLVFLSGHVAMDSVPHSAPLESPIG
jgi:hypothetical protein